MGDSEHQGTAGPDAGRGTTSVMSADQSLYGTPVSVFGCLFMLIAALSMGLKGANLQGASLNFVLGSVLTMFAALLWPSSVSRKSRLLVGAVALITGGAIYSIARSGPLQPDTYLWVVGVCSSGAGIGFKQMRSITKTSGNGA